MATGQQAARTLDDVGREGMLGCRAVAIPAVDLERAVDSGERAVNLPLRAVSLPEYCSSS
jgi:hypothetical protein